MPNPASFLIQFFHIALTCLPTASQAQDVYKTPAGEKYHLATCRMVENVSKKLVSDADIYESGLEPCKICHPPERSALLKSYSSKNKAVGEAKSVQCTATTQEGTRCRHMTKMANGFCYQHDGLSQEKRLEKEEKPIPSSICGAKTKSGGFCQRKVSNGGRCFQH